MVGYLNAHGTMPHLYPQFEGMQFDPDNNDVVTTDELDEPFYLSFTHELGDETGEEFDIDEFGKDDRLYCDDDCEPPLQTMEEIAKWVADRYWYILDEIENGKHESQSVTAGMQFSINQSACICGGRRSPEPSGNPFEDEDRINRRWFKRSKHGRGPVTEVIWKRRAGGGRRGRATLRTMAVESVMDA